ncbi:MAG TPA: zinc ribbon domain-containing protein [Solirubrobacteraceae bacterium]
MSMQTDNDSEQQRHEPAGSCKECGAAHAQDQRYCLECGAPLPAAEATVPLPVVPADVALAATGTASNHGLQQPAGASASLGSPSFAGMVPPAGGYASGAVVPAAAGNGQPLPPGYAPPPSEPPLPPAGARGGSSGSAPTVIAGVGVLLLAMGVGVLIGRAGNSSAPANNTPQVITVPATGTTAPSEEAEGAEESSGTSTGSSGNEAKKSQGSSKHSGDSSKAKGETGSSKSPASPSKAVQELEKPSKESYEQKSNNLPNVVGT